jgi:N-acetylmuramoyl-L-alanine amidase
MSAVILIDAGHGGQDPGVTWPLVPHSDTYELVEKTLTLSLARQLRQALYDTGLDMAVELTRDEDEDLSLRARGALCKKYDADLVISLHINSSPNPATSGMITFSRLGDALGCSVAKVITGQAPPELRRKVNAFFEADPKQDWLDRARHVVEVFAPAACVLVECGHASNAGDREELHRPGVQRGIVDACLLGVEHYLVMTGRFPAPAGGRPLVA